jgi:hypothetical protein
VYPYNQAIMPKREVPSTVQALLKVDKSVTSKICDISERFAATRSIKKQGKALEVSFVLEHFIFDHYSVCLTRAL